jgi:hypothetical protein
MTAAKVALYADDIAAWHASASLEAITRHLQEFLDHIQHWLSQWRVKLNATKTVYTVFTRSRTDISIDIRFNGVPLNYTDRPKFLGVTLDPSLSFKHYINDLVTRCEKRINMMRKIKGRNWGASPQLLLITYKTLIRSLIDYAPIIQILLPKTKMDLIEKIQHIATRIICGGLPRGTSFAELYKSLEIDSLSDRAVSLSITYWDAALTENQLISELYQQYSASSEFFEGAELRRVNSRTTLIGTILHHKEAQLPTTTVS